MKFLLFWKYLLGSLVGTGILLAAQWRFHWTTPENIGEQPKLWRLTEAPLKELAAPHGLLIGAAVDYARLEADPAYAALVTSQFNLLVAENSMKLTHTHPHPNTYTFEAADKLIDFAERHNMKMRGHTLIWHALPQWIKDKDDWQKDELELVMAEHITTVVSHFRGRVAYWDVVNEALSGYFGMRRTVWSKTLGDNFADRAFIYAHQADPEVKLFYNDFRVEGLNPKANRLYDYVKGMKERGVPIHGVGLQSHMHFGLPSYEAMVAHFERLASLGLEIHLTEIDVGIPKPVTRGKLIKQAIRYRRLLDACLAVKACTAYVLWGASDKYSWIPLFFKSYDQPLLHDANFKPKLAYYAVSNGLLGE